MAAVESEQDTRDEFNDSNNSGENVSVNSEGEADDIIERLQDVTTLTVPDRDIPSSIGDSDSTRSTEPGETESVGAASQSDSGSVSQPESREGDSEHITNGHDTVSNASTENTDDGQSDNNQNKTGGKDSTKKKGLNPVKGLLRKFTRSSSKSGESVAKGATKNKSETAEDLSSVTVDKLPQCFIVKYLGRRQCDGLWGIKHVRKPVDEMVKRVTRQLETGDKPVELPLMYLIVSSKGLELRAHPNNRVNDPNLPEKGGGFPIDFISYGVQDLKFWRVFTFIVVQELSARSKKMDCHAFICDSSVAARKVALSLALGFKVNMNKLKKEGKEHRFQVDLRPPGELADKYSSAEDGAEAEVADC